MYTKILMAKLKFPNHLSEEARNFLGGLLDRDPKKRLGAKSGKEVKEHKFFDGIDFGKLLKKEIEPPFKPKHQEDGKEDTTNVEADFLKELPSETPMENLPIDGDVRDAFKGFTYEQGSGMLS
mmetsp:Transcript_9406/g.15215  ORF Transcript_9406/g.15215 Transcript_9406/m.15215 type:complete len:123 (+) Transcript_9406:271-639(+)